MKRANRDQEPIGFLMLGYTFGPVEASIPLDGVSPMLLGCHRSAGA